MSLILCIESATGICSVALSQNEHCLLELNNNEGNAHAAALHPMVENLLQKTGYNFQSLDAVAISMGPGSYTGLRVGVSAAKGYAYSLGIPLLAVNSLAALANRFMLFNPDLNGLLVPMTDARRMEVYTAVYNLHGEEIVKTQAKILDQESFTDLLEANTLHFMGNGSAKFNELIQHANARFHPMFHAGAAGIASLAYNRFTNKQFENLAYFEPYYLKEFVGTTPKRKG